MASFLGSPAEARFAADGAFASAGGLIEIGLQADIRFPI
jgi:hypothetical protein